MKIPLFYVAVSFALGIVAQRELSILIEIIIAIFVAFNWKQKLPIIAFVALGAIIATITQTRNKIPYNQPVELISRIETIPTLSNNGKWKKTTCQVVNYKDSSGVWKKADQRIQIFIDTSFTIKLGNTIHFRTQQLPIDSTYRKYYINKGITGTVFTRNPRLVESDTTTVGRIKLYSQSLSDKIGEINTSAENIALMQALTVGDKREISREQRQANVRAGTAHILAVSGMHVGIIIMMLIPFLGWIKLFRRGIVIYGIVMILCLWGYAAITGFLAPVMRAVLMFTLYQIGSMISRNSNNLNTLSAAGFILLLINPNSLYDIGFQLSFTAMFGIVLLYKPVYNIWPNKVWSLIAISISAQIAVIPLACYYFGNIPFFGIFTNLALWIIVPIIIIVAFLYLLTGYAPIGDLAAGVASVYNNFVGWSSSHSWIAVEGVVMPLWVALAIYGLMILSAKIWLMPKRGLPNYSGH